MKIINCKYSISNIMTNMQKNKQKSKQQTYITYY